MSWLLYVCLDLIFTVLCYLTNWFVVIFADEKGSCLKYSSCGKPTIIPLISAGRCSKSSRSSCAMTSTVTIFIITK